MMGGNNKNIFRQKWRGIFLFFLFCALCPFAPEEASAATFTSVATGNWQDCNTWGTCPGAVEGTDWPGSADTAVITSTHNVTVTVNQTVDIIQFNSASTAGTITVNTGVTLTATTSITLRGLTTGNTAATLTGSGTGAISTGALTVGENLAYTGNRTIILTSTVPSLSISGNLNLLSYRGSSTSRNGQATFNLESGTVTVSTSITSTNETSTNTSTFSMASGAQSGTLNLSGATPWSLSGTGTNTTTLNGTTAVVNYNSSSAQTVRGTTYTTLKINNTNASGATLGAATTTTTLTIGDTSSAILNDGGYQLTSTGTLNLTSGTFKLGSAGTGTTYPAFATNNISSGTTVEYASNASQTIAAVNYANLTSSGSGARTLASSGTIGVSGTFTPGSNTYTVTGSTVDFNGTGAQTVPAFNYNNLTISGARTTNSVTLASSGTIGVASTFSPTATFTSGSYVITGSTVDFNGSGSQTIPAFNYNNLTNSGGAIISYVDNSYTGYAETDDITLTRPTNTTDNDIMIAFIEKYNDTEPGIPSGWTRFAVANYSTSFYVYAYWKKAEASDPSTWTWTWTGTQATGGGIITYRNASYSTADPFDGTATTNSSNSTSTSTFLSISPSTSTAMEIGIVGHSSAGTSSGAYWTFRVNPSDDFAVGEKLLSSSGATGDQTMTVPGTLWANIHLALKAQGTSRTLASSGTIGVTGTFTPGTSSYTVTGSTVDFNNSTGSQTIPAFTFNNLTLSNTSGTDTAGGNVVVNGTLVTTASGTLDMTSAYTLSGTLGTITNNGTITTAVPTATSATPLASGKTWGGSGTVSYVAATAQTVVAGTYNTLDVKPAGNSVTTVFEAGTVTVNGNLTIGNGTNTGVVVSATGNDPNITVAGNVTVSANTTLANSDLNTATLNIDGNLTITGTFTAPVGTGDTAFTLGGNFTNNGTFNDANGRLVIDGTGTSALTYSADTTFHDLKIATAGKTIQFDEAQATVIESGGNFIVQGTNCTTGRVFLDSYVDNNAWDITITGATLDIDYADIEDSNGTGSPSADNSTADNGGNTGWTVNAGACSSNQNPNVPASLTQKNGSDVAITESAWTNSNTPKLGFTITDPDSDTVKYEVQVATDSGFSSLVLDYTHGSLSASGTVFSFVVGTYTGGSCTGTCPSTLSDSATGYWWRVKAIDEHDASSANVEFGVAGTVDFKVDATAPTSGSVYDGTSGDQDWNDGSLTQISGNWTDFNTDVSGLSKYEYAIRRKPDDYYWSVCSGAGVWQAGANWCDNTTSTSYTQNTLNLSTGVTYYVSVRTTDNAGNVETVVDSNGQQVLPLLSFSLSGNTVAFNNLNAGNNYTDTKTITTTTSTNASNGYTIKIYNTDSLRSTGVPGTTIPDFSGTWSSPASWGGGQYGFGYTSSDTSVQGSNRFSGGTAFAAFTQTPPGDVVADHTDTVNGTTGTISNQQFTITYKVAASTSQAALYYQTTSIFIVTANY